jgi:hypothetical protein
MLTLTMSAVGRKADVPRNGSTDAVYEYAPY